MQNLLNLLAAIALLVWGTHTVRTGILRVFGARLRQVLARSIRSRGSAAAAGVAVTALVQSSTATALILAAFVGQGLLTLPVALAAMLGADLGTSLMAVVYSFDLSWLSPLCVLVGVVLFIARPASDAGRCGRILIGLGLMLLALRLVSAAAAVLTQSAAVTALLGSLGSDLLLQITLGALLTIVAYSSLAVVLLTAALAASGAVPLQVALGLVLGANLGSGLLAVLTTARSAVEVRQVPLGNLVFKLLGVAALAPLPGLWAQHLRPWLRDDATAVVLFHLGFNTLAALLLLGATQHVAGWVQRWLPRPDAAAPLTARRRHLDPSALATPSLAIACAAREALHQADVVETMVRGLLQVIQRNDLRLAEELRRLDDTVDQLYSAIKYYLTKISREALAEEESRRWTDIISFTINMEQIGDIVERAILDVEHKKIRPGRSFSDAGMAEICELHARLLDNMRLAMGVFLNRSLGDARRLLEAKARFRDLERAYAGTHLARLADNTVQSIETSSLHIDLIGELRRINSHICSVAYPALESAGALAPNRLQAPQWVAP